MSRIIEALKKYAVVIGAAGTVDDVKGDTIEDVINFIVDELTEAQETDAEG